MILEKDQLSQESFRRTEKYISCQCFMPESKIINIMRMNISRFYMDCIIWNIQRKSLEQIRMSVSMEERFYEKVYAILDKGKAFLSGR